MKEGYKNTSIGEIPVDWRVKQFDALGEVTSSKRIHRSDYIDEGIPFFRGKEITQLSKGEALNDLVYISENRFNELKNKFGSPTGGDILITAVGTIGSIYLVKENDEFYFKDGNLIWLRKIDKDLDKRFLAHYLRSVIFQGFIDSISSGSSQKALTIVKLKKLSLAIPSITEQQKIAEILSTVDEKINAIDQRIAETQELKKGLMQQLLTKGIGHTQFKDSLLGEIPESWEVKKVEEVSNVIDSLHITPSFSDTGYPMVRVGDINKPKLNLNNCLKVNEKIFNDFKRNHKPVKGDILMTRVGSFGKTIMVDTDEDFCIGQNTVVITNAIEPIFLYYTFNSDFIQKQFGILTSGSSQPSLSLKNIRNLNIAFPPIKEQQQIAKILSASDKKLQIQRDKKVEYQELKKGLMQQLLTGRIRVEV